METSHRISLSEYMGRYQKERPLAVLAIKLVNFEIRCGRMLSAVKSGKCWDCGRMASCWDHRDYTKPLEVEPLCRSCNRRRGPGAPYLNASSLTGNKQRPFKYPHVMRAFHTGDLKAAARNRRKYPKIRVR